MANTTIEELLNLAYEVRDADQAGENTALRVGGLLEEIIQYLSTVVDLDTLQAIMEQYATLSGPGGLIYWRHSRIICLASMGYDLDNIDGGNWNYTNHNGDIVFRPSSAGGGLRVVGTTDEYSVFSNVVYVNNHTGHAYIWEQVGSTFKMVEIRDSSPTTIITYLNTPSFSQVAVGESYYYSSGNNRKIAIKLSSDEVYSFDPDPKKIYVFLDTRQAMVWDAGNRQWISVGGGNVDVINNLTEGGTDVPLSAEMGKRLKQAIEVVQYNIQGLYNNLGNIAFWDATAKANAAPDQIDWGNPKHNVTLALSLTNAVVKYNGVAKVNGDTIQVEEGGTLTLKIEPASGYALNGVPTVSVGGNTVQPTDNGNGTYSVAITMGQSAIAVSISATAAAMVSVGIVTSNAAGALGLSVGQVAQGGTFVGQVTYEDDYFNDFEITSVKDASNNDVTYTLDGNEITIANVPSAITITAVAKKIVDVWFGKSLNMFGGMVTANNECVSDYIRVDQLDNSKGNWYANLPDGAGNESRCLLLYDSDKRLIYIDGAYGTARVPSYLTNSSSAGRFVTTQWLNQILTAAGNKKPLYVRVTSKCNGTTVDNTIYFRQTINSVQVNHIALLTNSATYRSASTTPAQHSLSFTLSNVNNDSGMTTPITFPDGQPLETSFIATSGDINNATIVVTMGGETLVQGTDYTVTIKHITSGELANNDVAVVRIESVTGDVNFNVSIA